MRCPVKFPNFKEQLFEEDLRAPASAHLLLSTDFSDILAVH